MADRDRRRRRLPRHHCDLPRPLLGAAALSWYRLDIGYDGTEFHGYARQEGMATVQGRLESALFRHTGEIETSVAGRTDAGVHARAQVVGFESDGDLDLATLSRSLNRQLGPSISISAARRLEEPFSARFDATWRAYDYLVVDGPSHDAMLARYSLHVEERLRDEPMSEACASFVGEHDFSSLCRRSGDRSLVRVVEDARWVRAAQGRLKFSVTASSFCHQMVRSMVAICLDVGRGKIAAGSVAAVLDARDRRAARGAAPAHGLALVGVGYEARHGGPSTAPSLW